MVKFRFFLALFLACFFVQGQAAFYNKKGEVLISAEGEINKLKLQASALEWRWGPVSIENIESLPPPKRVDFARKIAKKKGTPIYGPSPARKPGSTPKPTDRYRQKPVPALPPRPQGVFSLEEVFERNRLWPRTGGLPSNWIRSLGPTLAYYESNQDKLSSRELEKFEFLRGNQESSSIWHKGPRYPNPFDPDDHPMPDDDEAITDDEDWDA